MSRLEYRLGYKFGEIVGSLLALSLTAKVMIFTGIVFCLLASGCFLLGTIDNSQSVISSIRTPTPENFSINSFVTAAPTIFYYSPSPTPLSNQLSKNCKIRNNVEGYNDVNLRSEPRVKARVLGTYKNGTSVTILTTMPVDSNGFKWIQIKVTSNGIIGWIVNSKLVC